MEIILLEKIEKLGNLGDVVTVKNGFARNYLLPQKKALRATNKNKKVFDDRKAEITKKNESLKKEALSLSKKIKDLNIAIIRQASDQGQLYGSVTARDIVGELNADNITLTPKQVRLNQSIKNLGLYKIKIYLHPEVIVDLDLNIARSKEEADIQLKEGKISLKSTISKKEKTIKSEEVFESEKQIEQYENKINSNENESNGVENKIDNDESKLLESEKNESQKPISAKENKNLESSQEKEIKKDKN